MKASTQERQVRSRQALQAVVEPVLSCLNRRGQITQLMERAKTEIDRRERGMKLSPPSAPQSFIGGAVRNWAEQRLDLWLKTP